MRHNTSTISASSHIKWKWISVRELILAIHNMKYLYEVEKQIGIAIEVRSNFYREEFSVQDTVDLNVPAFK